MNESIKKGFIKRAQEYGIPSYKAESLFKKADTPADYYPHYYVDAKDYINRITSDYPENSAAIGGVIGALGGGAAGYYLKDKDKRTWKDALMGAGVGGLGGAALGYATGKDGRAGMFEGEKAMGDPGNKFKSMVAPDYNPFSKADPSETTTTALGALAGAGIGGIANYQGNPHSALKGALVGGLVGGLGTHTYRDAARAAKEEGFDIAADFRKVKGHY